MSRAWRVAFVVAAVAPAVVLVCVEFGVLVWASVAGHPRWPDEHLNLSEAAATRDTAEMVRLIDGGHDPNGHYPVRPGLVDNNAEVHITPLEAAIAIRRAELVDLLFKDGVRLTADEWARLRCVAAMSDDEELIAAVDKGGSGQRDPSCTGRETLW